MKRRMGPAPAGKLWLSVFFIWALFLSGLPEKLTGSPGLLQALKLHDLLQSKKKQISRLENDLETLTAQSELLEKNRNAQQREIRRVLGYSGSDEIIFEFASPDRL